MTNIYLIRHATYDEMENGVELENPGLSAEGIQQAERLRDWKSGKPRQTVAPIAKSETCGKRVGVGDATTSAYTPLDDLRP